MLNKGRLAHVHPHYKRHLALRVGANVDSKDSRLAERNQRLVRTRRYRDTVPPTETGASQEAGEIGAGKRPPNGRKPQPQSAAPCYPPKDTPMPARPRGEPADNQLNVRLPTSLRNAVEQAAEREGRTAGDIVRRLLTARLRADGDLATST
jgi:hypothetical protein